MVFERLDPRDLEGRAFDAYVNTACPRIALDDGASFGRPVLTPPEFLMALGESAARPVPLRYLPLAVRAGSWSPLP